MHPNRGRKITRYVAFHQRNMFSICDIVGVNDHPELAAKGAIELGIQGSRNNAVVAQAIGDKVGDGADFQAM